MGRRPELLRELKAVLDHLAPERPRSQALEGLRRPAGERVQFADRGTVATVVPRFGEELCLVHLDGHVAVFSLARNSLTCPREISHVILPAVGYSRCSALAVIALALTVQEGSGFMPDDPGSLPILKAMRRRRRAKEFVFVDLKVRAVQLREEGVVYSYRSRHFRAKLDRKSDSIGRAGVLGLLYRKWGRSILPRP